jgi:hypothetical protein
VVSGVLVVTLVLGCSSVDEGDASTPPAGNEGTATALRSATAARTTTVVSADNPFDYCGAVVDIDAPDSRYTGPAVPAAVTEGLKQVLNASAVTGVSWRCMGGKVYACTVGANLPCQEKANLDRTPNTGTTDFCRANPNAAVVPAVATGRATVYSWKCTNGTPEAVGQNFQPDARGFIANFWHEIPR